MSSGTPDASINYSHLRYFWAVAHEKNLTAAARRLFVSQSAVSVQIRALEKALGHDLFERRAKGLHLTEAGRIVLDHADAIFATGEELLNTLRAGAGSPRLVLRVGALANLSRNFQLQFLSPIMSRRDTQWILRTGSLKELMAQLDSHRLDVVLANSAPPSDGNKAWVVHQLAHQRVSLVRHRDHRPKGRTLLEWLRQEPLVLPSGQSSIRVGFDAMLHRLGIKPLVVADVDDMAMMRVLARSNLGLAVVPSIVVRDELESGLLVEMDRLPGLRETFVAITLARRFPHPLLSYLLKSR